MKSNQERSNECLPPKKREILALEERQVLVASSVNENQNGENLAWLASVATMARMASVPSHAPLGSGTAETETASPSTPSVSTGYLPCTSVCNSSWSPHMGSTPKGSLCGTSTITANPAILSSSLPQAAGPIPHTQLPPNIQIIGPYTGYISSQIVPAAASPTQTCRTTQEVYATTAVIPQAPSGNLQKQHVVSSLASAAHTTSQCIQVEGAPVGLTVTSPSPQVPLQLHPHPAVLAPHGLTLAPSQLLLHYADGLITKHPDSQSRDLQNGALGEMIKHGAGVAKESSTKPESDDNQRQNQNLGVHAQTQVLLPADYATHDGAGLQTSLMLVSSSHLVASNSTELQSSLDKDQSSLARVERAGLSVGKPGSRVSSLTLSSADGLTAPLAPALSSHALLQTSPCAPTHEPASLYSATQLPIIGYITSTSGGPQQVMASYHSNLPQHLVISSNPSLLIPVSASSISTSSSDAEVTHCSISTIPHANVPTVATGLPQAYITTATPAVAGSVAPTHKEVAVSEGHHGTAAPQSSSQGQLPVLSGSLVPSPTPALTPASASPQNTPLSPSSALPPYFMKGSIIQLADGELKRVEDLRAEDFLQSADLSGELKIDSSTVERIDSSRTPDAVVIQFSVGERKAQVCVEVLEEYPFFVFGQGWSSCCPDRTTQLLALSCAKLSVGDVCISLTLKSLRNGALRKDQTFGSVLNHNTNHVKTTKTNGQAGETDARTKDASAGSSRADGEQAVEGSGLETLTSEKAVVLSKDGEGQQRGAGGRKRRWSAPERGEIEKRSEDVLPETLPKMSFLSQEVKVSIEGRSSVAS
ncbi:ataxin-1 [Brachyhypopomus gauderio]|uniref:ataxin-1 n=1 Tax=Brachyhypopomus gauderio TaxID=698409 RepID=UPI004042644E